MKKNLPRCTAAAFLAAVFLSGCRFPFPSRTGDGSSIRILTWNCQTLFDDVSSGTEYDGYDPARDGWSSELYRKKLSNVAAVIKASVPGGPEIVALQEIENGNVLVALAGEYLKGMGYGYTAVTSVPGSALQVGFLSRLEIRRSVSHGVSRYPGDGGPLRNILETEFVSGGRPLVVFNNHWKSKAGAEDSATEPVRIRYAEALAERIREIGLLEPRTDVVALGDFNESVDEYDRKGAAYRTALLPADAEVPAGWENGGIFLVPSSGFTPTRAAVRRSGVLLADPWSESDFPGSYYYGNEWLSIDHTLLAPSLFDGESFEYSGFRVVRDPPVSAADGRPFRWDTYRKDGFSDHFPLVLTLKHGKTGD